MSRDNVQCLGIMFSVLEHCLVSRDNVLGSRDNFPCLRIMFVSRVNDDHYDQCIEMFTVPVLQ